MGAADSFPLSSAGELGVPSPGLYLVYAQVPDGCVTCTTLCQVTYLNKAKEVSFSLEVNNRPKMICLER